MLFHLSVGGQHPRMRCTCDLRGEHERMENRSNDEYQLGQLHDVLAVARYSIAYPNRRPTIHVKQ